MGRRTVSLQGCGFLFYGIFLILLSFLLVGNLSEEGFWTNQNDIMRSRYFHMCTHEFKLYLITDRKFFKAQCLMYIAIESALEAGVQYIQLREKDLSTRELFNMAVWIRELTKEYDAKLFINDRVDVALSADADGVHLGRKSIPAHAVRKISGSKLMIGVSTHSIDEATEAEKDGADFITLGPVYETPSKLKYGKPVGIDMIRKVKSQVSIPVLAIGGIKLDKVKEVKEAGADGIALISAILTSENIKETTEEFLRLVK
jgi:thiamine-phosphate pyrophosphorylase